MACTLRAVLLDWRTTPIGLTGYAANDAFGENFAGTPLRETLPRQLTAARHAQYKHLRRNEAEDLVGGRPRHMAATLELTAYEGAARDLVAYTADRRG